MSLTILFATPTRAEDACVRDGARVCCAEDGFKKLTDLAITFRAASEKCIIRLEQTQADLAGERRSLSACRVALDAVPPPEPPKSPMLPLAGYAAGVFGTVLSVLAVVVVPDNARVAVGATGAALLAGGVFLVLP